MSSLFRSVEEKFVDKSFCLFVVAKINTSEQMCGIVHQFKILNPFQFYRPKTMTEEFPHENEWEKDDEDNDFQKGIKYQIGQLDKVHPSLTPPRFVKEGQDYIPHENT